MYTVYSLFIHVYFCFCNIQCTSTVCLRKVIHVRLYSFLFTGRAPWGHFRRMVRGCSHYILSSRPSSGYSIWSQPLRKITSVGCSLSPLSEAVSKRCAHNTFFGNVSFCHWPPSSSSFTHPSSPAPIPPLPASRLHPQRGMWTAPGPNFRPRLEKTLPTSVILLR